MGLQLPPNLQADYTELVNEYLDRIPIQAMDDFHLLGEALQSIIEPTHRHLVHRTFARRIDSIIEFLDHPELYAQQPAVQQLFKRLVLLRVAAKIRELKQLTYTEKARYIAEQRHTRTLTAENQNRLSHAVPPSRSIRELFQDVIAYILEPHPDMVRMPLGRAGVFR